MHKKSRKLLVFLSLLALNATLVAAQEMSRMLDAMRRTGIFDSVQTHPEVWDAIVLIVIMSVLGSKALGQYAGTPGRGGLIGAMVAIISYAGLRTMNYSLMRDLGPWVGLGAVLALIWFLTKLFTTGQASGVTMGVVGITIFLSIVYLHPPFRQFLEKFELLFGIITLLYFFGIIFTAVRGIQLIMGSVGSGQAGGFSGRLANGAENLGNAAARIGGPLAGATGRGIGKGWNRMFGKPTEAQLEEFNRDLNALNAQIPTLHAEMQRFAASMQAAGAHNVSQFLGSIGRLPAAEQARFMNEMNRSWNQALNSINVLSGMLNQIQNRRYVRKLPAAEMATLAQARTQIEQGIADFMALI